MILSGIERKRNDEYRQRERTERERDDELALFPDPLSSVRAPHSMSWQRRTLRCWHQPRWPTCRNDPRLSSRTRRASLPGSAAVTQQFTQIKVTGLQHVY